MNTRKTIDRTIDRTIEEGRDRAALNKKRIRIPLQLISNRDFPHDAFALLVELKIRAIDNKVGFYTRDLRQSLRWTDNRRVKRYFKILFDMGLIDREITTFAGFQRNELTLIDMDAGDSFTQVDVGTIEKIRAVSQLVTVAGRDKKLDVYSSALRLFYYYEKNYNTAYGKAFPTYEQIGKDTKLSPPYIKGINDVFHESGIVKIKIGEGYLDTENGHQVFRKQGNEYIPMCLRPTANME